MKKALKVAPDDADFKEGLERMRPLQNHDRGLASSYEKTSQ